MKSYATRAIVTKEFDWLLFALTLITAVIGIIVIYSATRTTGSNTNVIVQSGALIIGLGLMLFLCFFDYEQFKNAVKYIYIFAVAMLIIVLIFGTAILLYNVNKEALSNPLIASIFDIPIELFIYLIVFFVLGFLIYAFMFGAIGSTASKLEDINTSVMPITFLFIIAFMVVMFSMSSGSVDNTAMLVCSYIPFTSPMAMFTRICMSTVAWYEIAISIAILIGSTVGIGVLSAKIYRVGVLLYGMPPKFSTIMKTVFKKQ